MNIDKLNDLLAGNDSKLKCVSVVDDAISLVINIFHETTAPLIQEEINVIKERFVDQKQLVCFLSKYSSLRLYCSRDTDSSAFYIAHPSEWDVLAGEVNEWISDLAEDEVLGRDCEEWLETALVIGEIPESGNYFLLPTSGKYSGRICLFDHDGFEFTELAENLELFVEYLCTPNHELLQEISISTRYKDGSTDVQWVPVQFIL